MVSDGQLGRRGGGRRFSHQYILSREDLQGREMPCQVVGNDAFPAPRPPHNVHKFSSNPRVIGPSSRFRCIPHH